MRILKAKAASISKESSPKGVQVQLLKAQKLGQQVALGLPNQHLSDRPAADRRVLEYVPRQVPKTLPASYWWACLASKV